ncbi:hypothetical protein BKA59DRAFT_490075 [Fusarium tricinctum]|uniref:G domain-containing protein n=1 Tax=Fusarium tricinctum TaxID=61284 RepID=A0A8K0SBN2_9HYPO|nr:hypothetical protein BKA59DRAFT_490075 [Fusarium tricinctum]
MFLSVMNCRPVRTQKVTAYQCQWSDTTDIYLLDTPGFDDTSRSDTEVLIEIAACLTKTYEDDIKLSGILYLHRITDRRLGGSAKKNLMMFRKLCGKDGLKNVILVTTMWEDEQMEMGAKREQELIETKGFWGALVEEGAQVNRHDNTRASAMILLKSIAKKDTVIISIQKEMVSEHKDLNETEAGIGLNSDILMAEQRVKKEMLEALQMERQARMDQDEKSAEEQRQFRETMQKRFDHLNQERENLKISLREMKEQRRLFTELEEKYEASQERLLINRTVCSDSLSAEYPELVNRLKNSDIRGCPRHISLGADGYFFIKMKSGRTRWCLPPSIIAEITESNGKTEMKDLSRLWLGYGNNYVAEIHSIVFNRS